MPSGLGASNVCPLLASSIASLVLFLPPTPRTLGTRNPETVIAEPQITPKIPPNYTK